MAQTKISSPLLLLVTISSFSLLLLFPVSSSPPPFKAVVSPITKDTETSLYTIPVNDNSPLVLDLNGPLIWSLCTSNHKTIPRNSSTCAAAAKFQPPECGCNTTSSLRNNKCICTAYPVNPVTGNCSSGDLTFMPSVTTNATDGKNPLYQVGFSDLVSSCAPRSLLSSLPSGATGVAGLGRSSKLSLPCQLSSFNLEKQFALCLPSGGAGVAFFGSKPFDLIHMTSDRNISDYLTYTNLLKNPVNPAYYIDAKLVAVNTEAVPLPAHALELHKKANGGGVTLTTAIPYTALRSDIYKPFLKAYDEASSYIQRVAPVKPFELCYNSTTMGSTRMGYAVPQIDLVLNGGKNWTIFGGNSIVQVDPVTACFGFVDAGPKADKAIQIGGFQMENILVLFDLERKRMGYTGLLFGIMTTCSNFNFTYAGGF
ncbi:chitinase CLP-like [Typha latifolia]|uniref:chitinase CLP-like n=1 Tax=Typha latifolia TaxID=4733 RepID=UPI003C2AC6FA